MENKEISEHFVLHLIRPASPDKKKKSKTRGKRKRKNFKPIPLMNINATMLNFFFCQVKGSHRINSGTEIWFSFS